MDSPDALTAEKAAETISIAATVTPNGKILYVTSGCFDLMGNTQEELIGSLLKEYIHPNDSFFLESFLFTEEEGELFEFRMKKKDGTYFWVEAHIKHLHNNSTREILLYITRRNIGEIVYPANSCPSPGQSCFRAREHIGSAILGEAPLLIENSPSPILMLHEEKFIYMNKCAQKMLGIDSEAEINELSVYRFLDQEYKEVFESRLERIKAGQATGVMEQRWRRMDGTPIEVEVRSLPFEIAGVTCVYLVMMDISSRKKFQDILQRSRERYRKLIQNSIDTIAVIFKDKWVFINDSGVELFGAPSYLDMLDKSVFSFLHPEDHEQVKEKLDYVTEQRKETGPVSQSWYTMDGKQVYTELICFPTTYFGEPAVQAIIRDISDRKRAEELMIKSEKLSIAGQLAAGIAHEIRNPLTAIKGFLQLIQIQTRENPQYFEIVFSELNRIELILSELLLLAKPASKVIKQADVTTLIHDVIRLLDTQAILNNSQFVFKYSESFLKIDCDENQLKQVFINFLKNAMEAMPSGGTIHIFAEAYEQEVQIIIKDEGTGIPPEMLARIGEPFYTTKEKGTGLGMMVSYNIIENHKGTISVYSEVNKGTTFTITLPLSQKR